MIVLFTCFISLNARKINTTFTIAAAALFYSYGFVNHTAHIYYSSSKK